jgi:predicted phage tail protein
MTAILIGLVFIVAGLMGMAHWFHDFLLVMRGFLPVSIFIGGVVSLIAGIASFETRSPDEKKNDK